MITATLAVLPGNRAYEVVGVAIGIAHIAPGRGTQDIARRQMEAEAGTLGADAIVDGISIWYLSVTGQASLPLRS